MAKVVFVQEIYFPFQSTARLSAYLKARGHEVGLVIGEKDGVVKQIREHNPDLIAFSVLTPYRNHMLETAAAIKRSGITTPIIAGGYDITFFPGVIERTDVDIICRGEGEEPLAELCERIDNNKSYTDIANLWVKEGKTLYKNKMRHWAMNLDSYPFDDRDLYFNYDSYFKLIPFTQILVGRGCPYLCSYCFNHGYRKIYQAEGSKGYCLLRSVDNVIAELDLLKNKYESRYFFFNDSTLGYSKPWLFEFLSKYKEKIKLPFSINAVISEMDEDVTRAISDNGYCTLIRLGLETGNEDFRRKVLNKFISNEQWTRGAALMRKYNIRYSMSMMFGLPGENLDLAWDTIRFAKDLSARDSVHAVNIFKPFPGLDITEHGVRLGQYRAEDVLTDKTPCLEKNEVVLIDKADNKGETVLGSKDMCFYQNYRIDQEGEILVRLSRFSHLAIRLPWIRPLVKKLVNFPDNFVYRFIWKITEGFLNIKAHGNVPMSFFFKYFIFHRGKKIR